MEISDITRLVLLYVVYPDYKLIDPINLITKKSNLGLKQILDSHPSFCGNPRAFRYIKSAPLTPEQIIFLQRNPEPRAIKLMLDWIDMFGNEEFFQRFINFDNPNPEYIEILVSKFPDICSIHFGNPNINKLFSCPSEKILNMCLPWLVKNGKYLPVDVFRNPHKLAVDYILENYDEFIKSAYLYHNLAENINPIIIKKLGITISELTACADLSMKPRKFCISMQTPDETVKKIIGELCANPANEAIELVKKYPQYIDFNQLVKNPNPKAIKLTKKIVEQMEQDRKISKSKIFSSCLTNLSLNANTNQEFIKWVYRIMESDNELKILPSDWAWANPAFFEVSKRNIQKIKLVEKIIETYQINSIISDELLEIPEFPKLQNNKKIDKKCVLL